MKQITVTLLVIGLLLFAGFVSPVGGEISKNFEKQNLENNQLEIQHLSNESSWSKTYGGSQYDVLKCVKQTNEGGYVAVGNTMSYEYGNSQLWLIKTDSEGNKIWDKNYGGAEFDAGNHIEQTKDGEFIIIGKTCSFGAGKQDIWLIKTDSEGNMKWNQTFGGVEDEEGNCVQQTSDDGFILAGWTKSFGAGGYDGWLIKTDSNGKKEWDKTFGRKDSDALYSVKLIGNEEYILAGILSTFKILLGGYLDDIWLIKTDSKGNIKWDKTFGCYRGSDGMNFGSDSLQITSDGGFIIASDTLRDLNFDDLPTSCAYLIKTDRNGNKEWEQIFGFEELICQFMGVVQTNDNGYAMTGSTTVGGVWLFETDSKGIYKYGKTYGQEVAFSIQKTFDEGYIIAGRKNSGINSDGWLIKQEKVTGLPPCKPEKPSGSTIVRLGETSTYSTVSTDPEGDQIKYCFYWGDGTITWTDFVDSGETVEAEHTWKNQGRYSIIVKAVDETKLESLWSNQLFIFNWRDRAINVPFTNFLKHNQNIFPILKQLLQFLEL